MAENPRDMEHNGARLAKIRRRRKLTQQQLADLVGYSLASVKKFEQGLRAVDRGQMILKFAEQLRCHPSEITGRSDLLPESDREAQIAAGAVAAVHRALLVHGYTPRITDAEVAAVDLAVLARRVRQAAAYRQASALARSGEILPGLLRDLQVAAATCQGDDRRLAFGLLASGYECAMQFTYKVGRTAVSTFATERVRLAVRETGDPLRVLSAEWHWAGEYICIGEHDVAAQLIEGALDELGGCADSPEAVSLRGMFHLKAALNSARAADATGAEMSLRHAARAADDLGADRNDFELQFGPTNVAVWSVSIPVEFGRGREAVRRGERVRLPGDYAAERRCSFEIDLGRAHYLNGQRELALDAFLVAEEIAPQQTRHHPGVRETVGAMSRTAPRGRLAELALRVGAV